MGAKVKWVPAYDLKRIQRYRAKLNAEILIGAEHRTGLYYALLDQEGFTELVERAMAVLRLPGRAEEHVRRLLGEFAGQEVTELIGDQIVMRLAGNAGALKKMKRPRLFAGFAKPTWAPVEIAEARLSTVRRDKLYLMMSFIVMAGPAAGTEIRQELPHKFVITKLARELGYPRRHRIPMHQELVRMWMMGRLYSGGKNGTQIAEFHVFPQYQKYNMGLKEERETPCIRGYEQQCSTCPVGYADCSRGTHRYTWIRKTCEKCRRDKPFDPGEPGETVCRACRNKGLKQIWARERRGLFR